MNRLTLLSVAAVSMAAMSFSGPRPLPAPSLPRQGMVTVPVGIFGAIADTMYMAFRMTSRPERDTIFLPLGKTGKAEASNVQKQLGMAHFKGTVVGGTPSDEVFGTTADVQSGKTAFRDPPRDNEVAQIVILRSRLSPDKDTLGIAVLYTCGRVCSGSGQFRFVRNDTLKAWKRDRMMLVQPDRKDQLVTGSKKKP